MIETADRLDQLFDDLAKAQRTWLRSYAKAKPPSLCTDGAHDKLIDAHQEVERLIAEIEAVFRDEVFA
jgi:hypothetical protein